jgi:hypothetical protein
MNTTPRPIETLQGESYQATRFNALRHGVLSRYTVLPWEDKAEYQTLLGALVAEHSPVGPTEEHLVEELAGIVWRKRRLRLAEAAVYRERLRKDAASNFEPEQIAGAALLPMIGKHKVEADIPRALTATSEETVRDLRDVKRDEAMTRKALNILVAGAPDTYSRALAALREDTRRCRSVWPSCAGRIRRRVPGRWPPLHAAGYGFAALGSECAPNPVRWPPAVRRAYGHALPPAAGSCIPPGVHRGSPGW